MSENVKEEIPDEIESLRKRLEDAEKEFGLKRAQFRQMYISCEEALQKEKKLHNVSSEKIDKLTKELDGLKSENQGIRAAAQLSDESRIEEISKIKTDHQEELASYQHIWKEAVAESKASVADTYEEERQQLIAKNLQLEQQIADRHSKSEDKPEGLMSMVSQAIKRTTTSQQQGNAQSKTKDSLEDTMKEAQENAESLRNIVRPLEEEISALKGKLKDTQTKLRHYENKNKSSNIDTSNATDGQSENVEELQEKVKDLQGYLDTERSSRTDLEMFVAVLNTQKGVLQEDADALRSELHNVCRLLEQERMSHRELKQTWRMANDEFLEQQTLFMMELDCMRELLLPNQLEKFSHNLRQKKKDRQKLIKLETPPSTKKLPKLSVGNLSPLLNRVSPIMSPSASSNQSIILSSSSASSDSETEKENLPMVSSPVNIEQKQGTEEDQNDDSMKKSNIRKSASSSNILSTSSASDIQDFTDLGVITPAKSRSQGDISSSILSETSTIDSPLSKEQQIEANLHLNETGWSTMAESNSFHQSCMMCQNYEKQLQRLQKECIAYKEKYDTLQSALKNEKEKFKSQVEENRALNNGISSTTGDVDNQLKLFKQDQEKQETTLTNLQTDFLELHREMIEQLDLSRQHEKISHPGISLLDQSSESQRDNVDGECQDESTSSAKEQELSGQIMFLKDRVMAEQFDKENMEKILQQDLDIAKQEIGLLKEKLAQAER